MLSEAAAWALLRQHCSSIGAGTQWLGIGFFHRAMWYNAGVDQVDLIVKPPAAPSDAPRGGYAVGVRLRLALAVARAVSCCRGFEPATHQHFWWRVAQSLWSHPTEQELVRSFAFSSTTFIRVGIQWAPRSPADDSFWEGFFHGTRGCDATLSSVLDTLRPHLVCDALPPLQLSLSHCRSGRFPGVWGDDHELNKRTGYTSVVMPDVLKTMLRAAAPTGPRRLRSAATHVGLVVEFCVDDNPYLARETLDLLAEVRTPTCQHLQFTIDRLAIQLAPPVAPRAAAPGARNLRALVTRVRPLGNFLHTLVVHNGRSAPLVRSVAVLECSYSDYRLVGAVLSAVALTSMPVEELRCSGLFDSERSNDQLMRLAWLAYALLRRQGPPLALSLVAGGALATTEEREYLHQLQAKGTPLRDVVGEALRLRLGGDDSKVAELNVECLPCGSKVRLARGTRLYVEPMRAGDEFVLVTVDFPTGPTRGGDDAGVEVDLIAHLIENGGSVGIVYGGYGLVWADERCVVPWHRVDSDVIMTDDNADPCGDRDADPECLALSSLEVNFKSVVLDLPFAQFPSIHRVSTMLPFFACETLQTLALDRVVVTRDDFAKILDSFPRLHTLTLDRCVVESLAPLTDAYRDVPWRGRRAKAQLIAVLSLHSARDVSTRDEMLAFGRTRKNPPVQPLHRSLQVEHDDDRAVAWMAPLLDALADGVTCGVLRSLHADLAGMREADQHAVVARLARAVTAAATRSLARLHVECRASLMAACAVQLRPLRGAVLRDPPRVRSATLSVLRARGCAAPAIVRMVLAWCEGSVVCTVTWTAQNC